MSDRGDAEQPDVSLLPYRPCVGLMILNQDGLIFAGRRLDGGGESPAWQMPQGGIDPGEAPLEAGLRELREETGLAPEHVEVLGETRDWVKYDVPLALIGKLWGGRYRGQTQKWFALRLTAPDSAVNIETEDPEFCEWRWMAADALIEAIVPFKRDIYRSVLGEFAPLREPS
ncbi:MAG: RNA pyrophosphohydrolase [Pseudomonadota bacterium]